jgi:hypothetical protein
MERSMMKPELLLILLFDSEDGFDVAGGRFELVAGL